MWRSLWVGRMTPALLCTSLGEIWSKICDFCSTGNLLVYKWVENAVLYNTRGENCSAASANFHSSERPEILWILWRNYKEVSALLSDWEVWAGSCFPSLQPPLNGAIKSKTNKQKPQNWSSWFQGMLVWKRSSSIKCFISKCSAREKKKKLTKISATI